MQRQEMEKLVSNAIALLTVNKAKKKTRNDLNILANYILHYGILSLADLPNASSLGSSQKKKKKKKRMVTDDENKSGEGGNKDRIDLGPVVCE
jgi:hypothetical protein